MKAIRVRCFGSTERLSSRWKADDGDGNTITIRNEDMAYAHLKNNTQARATAAALCDQMSWRGRLVEGGYGNDRFFVFDPLYPNHNPEMDYVSL